MVDRSRIFQSEFSGHRPDNSIRLPCLSFPPQSNVTFRDVTPWIGPAELADEEAELADEAAAR
jgi:hypothetical protein